MGSYREFKKNIATKVEMDRCMKMPGGGPWACGAGQVTDDSELAMSLLQAIVNSNAGSKGVLRKDAIAVMYGAWIKSPPFDIGLATRNALA